MITYPKLTRRDFLWLNAASLGLLSAGGAAWTTAESTAETAARLVDVDFQALISRSDLHYLSPVDNSVEGQPIGNGRMGTMVWTTPDGLQFQINRSDVFAVNRNHHGPWGIPFYQRPPGPTDFCGACARITIEWEGGPFQRGEHFRQDLSLYEAECHIQGDGILARCFVSAVADLLVLEIEDRRQRPEPIRLKLSLWRSKWEKMGDHLTRFEFSDSGETRCVVRRFTEHDYYCGASVAVQVANGHLELEEAGDTQQTLLIEPSASGKTLVLIGSAASMDAGVDLAAEARKPLADASGKSYEDLREKHRAWWSGFWARTFVHVSSADGVADFMERLRNIHLYLMASTSRGAFAPKWNGMLFNTEGDTRTFGSQYWGWTMETLYIPLFASGASDLADSYFNMYLAQLPNCRLAAAQRWNAKGAFFPETSPFDGPVTLPDDVAREYRDILLGRVKQENISDRARELGQYDAQLYNYAADAYIKAGRYSQISHIFSTGAKIAVHAWWRYRYTGDESWLRSHAYSFLRDAAEFYRSMAIKKEDGCYHVEGANVHESFMGVKDGIMDLAAIRGMVPLAIRAAEILEVDPELRTQWRDFLDNLVRYPMGSDPESKALSGGVLADDVWAAAHLGDVNGSERGDEDVWLNPIFPFEDYTLETRNQETQRIAEKLVGLVPIRKALLNGEMTDKLGTAVRTPIAISRTGRGEDLPAMLCSYYNAFPGRLPNGFSLFEGYQAHSIEHLGVISMAVQEALLQSLSPAPGQPEIIRVFPAWPKTWDASFSLFARGGFLVTASITQGSVSFVEIESRGGGTCQIHNPWVNRCFLVEGKNKKRLETNDVLRFETKIGRRYKLFPADLPSPIRIAPNPGPQASLSFKFPNGTLVQESLWRER